MHDDIIDAEFEEITEPTTRPLVNVGTPGHIDHGTQVPDSGYVPISPCEFDPPEEKPPLTRSEILVALKKAVDEDVITPKRALEIKRDIGINASSFTKKKASSDKRKLKRKAKKNARRKQRK